MRQTVYLNVGRPADRLRRITVGDVDEGQSVEGFSRALHALGDVNRPVPTAGNGRHDDTYDEPHIRIVSDEEAAIARRTQRRRTPPRSRKRRTSPRTPPRADLPTISLPSLAPSPGNGDQRVRLPEQARMVEAGRLLRAARTERGLTIDDIHRCIRIPARSLEALEGGTADGLPAPVYARGFLRCYGRLLEVDLSAVLDDGVEAVEGTGRRSVETRPPRYRRRRAAVAVAIGVVLVGGLLAAGAVGDSDGDPVAATATGPRSTATTRAKPAKPKPAAPKARPPAAATPISPVAADGGNLRYAVGGGDVRLIVTATGACWVRVDAGGRVLFEGTLQPGQQQALVAAAPLTVRLGNPTAVAVRAGDRPLTVAGPPGVPVNLLLTL
jgi:cytoskeleton protein RodZ